MTYQFENVNDPEGFATGDRVNVRLTCNVCGIPWTWSVDRSVLDLLPEIIRAMAEAIMDEHGEQVHR